ncbi:MAG: hypothetical protein RLZZ299_2220 [Pseudomonadota bacterium]
MHLLALLACSGSTPGIAPDPGLRPDVVLVTLDTTRADRLGAWGYAQARTDTIDRLAREGIRFSQAVSPLPLTIPAHATMFTGLLPYRHGIRNNGDGVLKPDVTTLAERFKAAGWATAASTAAFVTTRQWGFAQGFDAYFDELPERAASGDRNFWHTERPGNEVVDDAIRWMQLQSSDKPIFLWVHLYDAHHPYVARPGYPAKDPYDSELAFVDDQVQRLVDAFAERTAVFALIGDHGESLGEHLEGTHGLWAYQATAHVPWILQGAGITPGVVDRPVSAADLTPTLLHAAGLPVPEGLDGEVQPGGTRRPYVESWQATERFGLAPHRAVLDGTLKLIDTPMPELYDLAADPGERTNLATARPADVERLRADLAARDAKPPGAAEGTVDADTLAQLAQLGYVGNGVGALADAATYPDPKERTAFLEAVRALEIATERDDAAAIAAETERAFTLNPGSFEIRMRRATLLMRAGETDATRVLLDETTRLFPDRSRPWSMLAVQANTAHRWEDAVDAARRALAIDARDPAAAEALVEALFRLERPDDAVREGLVLVDAQPQAWNVAALLGDHFFRTGDALQAETNLRKAIAAPQPRRGARTQLALLALGAGYPDDARKLVDAELRDYPGAIPAWHVRARLLGQEQRWPDQARALARVAAARGTEPGVQRELAQARFNAKDYAGARTALDAALALAPDDPDVLLLHANLLAKEGRREEGLAALERANEANEARNRARVERSTATGTPSSTP